MKVAAFYKILLLIVFLGFGRSTGIPQGKDIAFDYEIDTDSRRNYGDIPTTNHVLFHERHSKLPSNSELKSHPGLSAINFNKDLNLLIGKSFTPQYNGEYITVGLDSLAIIFPFHTFF